MSVRNQLWIPIAACTVMLATAPPARADGKNQIRAVSIDEHDGVAAVHVRGAQPPTFTVYKLDKPTRVVIDLASATLDESVRGHDAGATWSPGAWAVSQISAQEMNDGGQLVRVVVTLARPGRWDVQQKGDEVIVVVTPRDPQPAGDADAAAARAEAAKAKQESASAKADAEKMKSEAARAKADAEMMKSEAARAKDATAAAQAEAARAKDAAAAAQAEAARAKAAAEQEAARAKDAERAAEAASRDAKTQQADRAAAKKMIDDARAEAARAKAAAAQAQDEAARARAAADAELARAKAAAEAAATAAQAEAARAKDEAARAKAAAEQEAARARDAQRAADAAIRDAKQQQADRAAAQKQIDDARAEAARAKQAAAQAQAEAERLRAEADRAHADAERAKQDASVRAASAQKQIDDARAEADRAKQDASARAASAQKMIDEARAEAARAKDEAARAHAEADRRVAEAQAELARVEADAASAREAAAKAQVAAKDAAAREAAAKDAQAAADRARAAAADAVRTAQAERDRARHDAQQAQAADRAKIDAAAKQAEDRLARAEAAAKDAEARRAQAEDAARVAKTDADRARSDADRARAAVADADEKRRTALAAASAAEDSRAQAEKGLADAKAQAQQAEAARIAAEKARAAAEAARAAADEQRAKAEQAAADATARAQRADKARQDEEAAAHAASIARADAEAKRDEAAKAAAALERSIAAEKAAAADAQARADEAARARAAADDAARRRASQKDVDAARAAADALDARKADADKVLAAKQAEVDRRQKDVVALDAARDRAADDLARTKAAADQARAARQDEEKQLAALEAQRKTAEQELARLEAQRKAAQQALAAAQKAAPPTPAPAPAPSAVTPVVAKAPTPTAAPAAKARTIAVKDVGFDHDDSSNQVVIALAGDATPQVVSTTDRRAELVLDGVDLPVRLERTLDTSRFAGPIKSVSSFRDPQQPGRVRVVVDLAQPATPVLAHAGTTWRWQFASAQPAPVAKASKAPRSIPTPVVAGYGASTPIAQTTVAQVAPQPNGKRKIYHGATIDLDTKDAPIHDLLRAISDVARVNIVIPDDINARVTVRLKRVPWDQALEVILASKGLWYRRDGNLIRVAPRKELDAEDEAEAARRAALAGAEAPDTEVLTLNYASAAEILPKLSPMLSPKGKLEVDERTNSLIIYDVRANRRHIQQLALQLDTQTPQISIEARVVEASSNYAREFGIQWGGNANASAAGGNATGLVFPSSIGLAGGADDKNTITSGVGALPSDFAVNLPAANVGNDEGGALGLSLGSVGGNFNINLRLSALEDTGTVRIVSSPKVTVLNNTEATISQGTRIPIQVVSAAGAQTQFVNAELSLVVRPYVSQRDCSIAMDLHVTKNEPDFVHTGARGDPTILSKEARTRLLVNDGETTVLGGIYTRNAGTSYNKVPYLADIPVFGWLFKRRRETDDRTELLIFITPKITNKAFLRCQ